EDVDPIGPQPPEASLDGGAKVLRRKVLRQRATHRRRQTRARQSEGADDRANEWFDAGHEHALRRKDVAGFARDHDFLAAGAERAADKRFALTLAVDVGCVEERDAVVEREGQEPYEFLRIVFENTAKPRATETKF